MTATPTIDDIFLEQFDEVEKHRYRTLVKSGFPPGPASSIAQRPDIDLHRAVDIINRGCTVDLALQILL